MGDITHFFDDVTRFLLIYRTDRDRYMKPCPNSKRYTLNGKLVGKSQTRKEIDYVQRMWQPSSEDSEIVDVADEGSLFCSRIGGCDPIFKINLHSNPKAS